MTLDALIERDGAACVWCGRAPWRTDLTAEHIVPRSRGGRSTPENLTVACRACNKRRGTRPVVSFVRSLLEEGVSPRSDSLLIGLGRLAASDRRDLAAYGTRQLALLERLLEDQAGVPHRRATDVVM
ncbi:MAG TPA: HNH endonuclease [Solirubrobacteraceae bacterium]|nr:HNH endonuclease [Solirubrobacteraceae bacterium]